MFLGHLPAGYLLSKLSVRKWQLSKYVFWGGLLGSVFPDFDLLYFYLIDGRQTLHHEYWMHLPSAWAVITLVGLVFLFVAKKKDWLPIWLLFIVNIFVHLVLDSIAGGVLWMHPFSTRSFQMFYIPSVHGFWVWNFVLHWTFLFEIVLIVSAVALFVRERMFGVPGSSNP